MQKRIYNRFRELLAIKERREGRRISQREVARVLNLASGTIDRLARNEVTRFDEHVLLALCEYFECELGELLIIEEVEADNPEAHALLDAIPA